MKIAIFTHRAGPRIGVVLDDSIIDLAAEAPELPRDMISFLAAGTPAMQRARQAAGSARRIPLTDVKLEAPIQRPPEFVAIGLNYADHVAETKSKAPEFGVPNLLQQTNDLREWSLRSNSSAASLESAGLRG